MYLNNLRIKISIKKMALVKTILVELGLAVMLLGYSSDAELCIEEGTPCKQDEPTGCTQRTVCINGTEINIGRDESGCNKCQKLCGEEGTSCKQDEPTGCTQRTVCINGTEINIGRDESGCNLCQKLCIEEEGTPCKQDEPTGCTRRKVCINGTEINIGRDVSGCNLCQKLCIEEEGCTRRKVCINGTEINIGQDESGYNQCQKPCSDKIYVMYSSLNDTTPATGWYTYKQNKGFQRNIKSEGISFFLRKKDDKWTLTEVKLGPPPEQREITRRIELSYKNDTRTIVSLDNFGIDENERRNLNIFVAPKVNMRYGTPYEEKLVIFCPGRCLCKKFIVKSFLSGYCFVGKYERIDSNETKQPKQEYITESSSLKNGNKNSYPSKSRSKRFTGPFANSNKDSATHEEKQKHYQVPKFSTNENRQKRYQVPNSHVSLPIANSDNNSAANDEQNNEQTPNFALSRLTSNPNNWFAINEAENQNWRKEFYSFIDESYDDKPFEFIFDEEYQVWFVGRGRDEISAVIPEASPCPEMIQKQHWFVIDEQYKLRKGENFTEKVMIQCTEWN